MARSRFPLHRPSIEEVPYNYIVSEWDDVRQVTGENLAMTNNGVIAQKAFETACEQRANRHIVLCNGSRIICRRDPKQIT